MESKPSYSCGDHLESSLTVGLLNEFITDTFIETGTNAGAGVRVAIKAGFKNIISIDIGPSYTMAAKANFRSSKNRSIKFINGDSAIRLPEILKDIHTRCTFWLDGHEMNAVPLLKELDAIANHHVKNHIIIIDDVRMFNHPSWGVGYANVIKALNRINPDYQITFHDSINAPKDILIAS